jgi:Zn-finger nucleic acid-binding protein
MRCPSCDEALDSLRVGEFELDECPKCEGLWFDQGELHAVLASRMALKRWPGARGSSEAASAQGPANASARGRLGPCCRCGGLLLEQTSAGHTLASCAKCGGFWVPMAAFLALRAKQPASEPDKRPAAAATLRGRCPACDTSMRPEERAGQGYHHCPGCGGLFLPRGGLPFLLQHAKGPFEPGPKPKEGVREHAGCPACRAVIRPISWQGRPVRVWACTECWGTFAPPAAVSQLQKPQTEQEPGFRGVGGGLWKMLDALVDWMVTPPKAKDLD